MPLVAEPNHQSRYPFSDLLFNRLEMNNSEGPHYDPIKEKTDELAKEIFEQEMKRFASQISSENDFGLKDDKGKQDLITRSIKLFKEGKTNFENIIGSVIVAVKDSWAPFFENIKEWCSSDEGLSKIMYTIQEGSEYDFMAMMSKPEIFIKSMTGLGFNHAIYNLNYLYRAGLNRLKNLGLDLNLNSYKEKISNSLNMIRDVCRIPGTLNIPELFYLYPNLQEEIEEAKLMFKADPDKFNELRAQHFAKASIHDDIVCIDNDSEFKFDAEVLKSDTRFNELIDYDSNQLGKKFNLRNFSNRGKRIGKGCPAMHAKLDEEYWKDLGKTMLEALYKQSLGIFNKFVFPHLIDERIS